MDLIVDAHNHAILTIVERSTNLLFMSPGEEVRAIGQSGQTSAAALQETHQDITTDNGPEFAAHKLITKYLGAIVYFADPYASWQKGAIENANNSSDSIFINKPTSMISQIKRLREYRRKSTVDPDKNSSLKHQKQSSLKE